MSIIIPASAIDSETTLVDGDGRYFIVDAVERDADGVSVSAHEFATDRVTLFQFDADEPVYVAAGD